VVAPLVEEPTKAAVLFLVLLSRHFDNSTDGFVYGAATGLGFAMTENFLYFATVAQSAGADPLAGVLAWAQTVLVRATYCATMHASASAIVGAALGFAHFRRRWAWWVALPGGFGLAFAVHGLWNGLLTADGVLGTGGLLTAANMVVFPLELAALMVVFQLCLRSEQRTLRVALAEEARAGVLPAAAGPPCPPAIRPSPAGYPSAPGWAAAVVGACAAGGAYQELTAKEAVRPWWSRART
jgi:protease PrsW